MNLIKKPKKGEYRQRAHSNPLSDSLLSHPTSPLHVNWSKHYPHIYKRQENYEMYLNTGDYPISYSPQEEDKEVNGMEGPKVEFLDVGCGYGGLLVALSPIYPKTLILGMEIRETVTEYVGERIRALRKENEHCHGYTNISVLRTNVMKCLVNYFHKQQLSKIFFCFPDPHFKKSNWKRRIISISMLSQYAFVMKPGGLLYAITDVQSLYEWMYNSCKTHPLFEEVSEIELANDECIPLLRTHTEESMKVNRNNGCTYTCVFRRTTDSSYDD